jgi:hypothetical protein
MEHQNKSPKTKVRIQIPWLPIDAPIKSNREDRSPNLYQVIIEQFEVEENPRYAPREGKTYCNILVWDVTRAMDAEIPHWVNSAGEPTAHYGTDAHRQNCNAMHKWLHLFGPKYGWHRVNLEEALKSATEGSPSIAIFYNPSGNGHVVIIRPDSNDPKVPLCAQAGKICFSKGTLIDAFGTIQPEFWTHE